MSAVLRLVAAGLLTAALVAAGLLTLPGLTVTVAAAPLPSTAQSAGSVGEPLAVTLDALAPLAPAAADTLTVTVTARLRVGEEAATPLRALRARLALGAPARTRAGLHQLAEASPGYGYLVASPLTPVDGGPLTVDDSSRQVTLQVPMATLLPALSRTGPDVYALRVELYNAGTRVGTLATWLPWFPVAPQPTRVAVVVALSAPPDRGAGDVVLSPSVRDAVTGGGRLDRLLATLAAARADPPSDLPGTLSPGLPAVPGTPVTATSRPGAGPLPVTIAVDPALLESVAVLAGPHQRQVGSGGTVGDGPDAAAASWLVGLQRAVAGGGRSVLALPYADPDLAAVAASPLRGDLRPPTREQQAATKKLLGGVTPVAGLVWPPSGATTAPALEQLDASTVLLDQVADPPRAAAPAFTPSAATPLPEQGATTALVSDDELSRLLVAAPGLDGPRAARQRFAAEVAMVTAERPNLPRDLVVLPPRDWSPDPGLGGQLLSDLASAPWSSVVPLSQVAAPDPATGLPRAGLTYPATQRAAELAPGRLHQLAGTENAILDFEEVLTSDRSTAQLRLALRRGLSWWWRGDPAGGEALRDQVAATLTTERGKVRLLDSGRTTLATQRAPVLVTVVNDLDQDVRVRVRLDALSKARFEPIGGLEVTVAAGQQNTVQMTAVTQSSGTFPVTPALYTPGGQLFQLFRPFTVRSTVYGRNAVLITVVASAVLLAGSLVRLVRRRRAGPGPAAGATGATGATG